MDSDGAVAENPKQIAEKIESLHAYASRIDNALVSLEGRITDILSPERVESEKVGANPPSTGDAPLTVNLSGIVESLERSSYRLESMFDRVEL